MNNQSYILALAFVVVSCSKTEEKPIAPAISPPPQSSLKEKAPLADTTIRMIPGDLTTSAGKPMVGVTVQLNSGSITKEKIETIVSKIHWTTFPEGIEIRFSYAWNPPAPYELPKDTPKGQTPNSGQPTDITGRPIQEGSATQNSEQLTSFSLTPEGVIEDRWYQISLDNTDNLFRTFENINPRRNGVAISRFNLASSPTIQNVELCKKSDKVQKVSIRFSEPVSYKKIKSSLEIAPLIEGSSCTFIEETSSQEQASAAEFLCAGLGGNAKAIKLVLGPDLVSASSKVPLAFLNAEASIQGNMFSSSNEIEIDFSNKSQMDENPCSLWTP
jgi:hypothetical protein